ncbi:MAG: hypothetical protein J6V60_04900, partial [Muribaculaceae bacterium]|nr:hypothetical protein [Muribaculaceae bacterium]
IGTPTSDHIRTAVDTTTRHILVTVNIYGDADMTDAEIDAEARRLLSDYCSASDIQSRIVRASQA